MEEFKCQATKIRGWPNEVLAEQYCLGFHPEVQETVLHSIHPVSLNAWIPKAVDAETRLRTIKIDNATTVGKTILASPKPKTLQLKKE